MTIQNDCGCKQVDIWTRKGTMEVNVIVDKLMNIVSTELPTDSIQKANIQFTDDKVYCWKCKKVCETMEEEN